MNKNKPPTAKRKLNKTKKEMKLTKKVHKFQNVKMFRKMFISISSASFFAVGIVAGCLYWDAYAMLLFFTVEVVGGMKWLLAAGCWMLLPLPYQCPSQVLDTFVAVLG